MINSLALKFTFTVTKTFSRKGLNGQGKDKAKMASPILNTGKLAGRTVYITGASRGIGREIALKLAKDRANIVIASKTAEPNPKLPGTIYTVAEEVESLGGQALPTIVDIRDEKQVENSVELAIKKFGGIDIVVNNASAINLTDTATTTMKKYDLMHQINGRGTFLVTKTCLPYLFRGKNPHILTIAPPISLFPCWYEGHVAYTASKFNMSMLSLGWAQEFREKGIKANCLWPSSPVYTAAVEAMMPAMKDRCRKPEILGDAAYVILSNEETEERNTGNFYMDEYVLRDAGLTDFDQYRMNKDVEPRNYGRFPDSIHSSQYIIADKDTVSAKL